MINVRDFGAYGDGITDNTIALRAAFNSVPDVGGIVYVPAGVYVVSGILSLKAKTYLKGAGAGTIFKRSNSGGDIIFFSETVNDVTIDSISVDINGPVAPEGQAAPKIFSTGVAFRNQCSNIRIRDVRIYDSTGTNRCCRHGILVLESDHVWIERNYLSNGLRIKAGGVGDKILIEGNIVEDANDNAITILTGASPSTTTNYHIRNNIVIAAKGAAIVMGDDGKPEGQPDRLPGQVHQNIIIEGNLIIGPALQGCVMILVKLATATERIHITNNILVNELLQRLWTQGIMITGQTELAQMGTDYLLANNTVYGAFDGGCIWVQSLNNIRIVNNQISNGGGTRAIRLTGVDRAIINNNIVAGCNIGIEIGDSINIQVMGNSLNNSPQYGIFLNSTVSVSGNIMGNKVSGSGNSGIYEQGVGSFDTHYLFNDLRNNTGGAFSNINANATRLGNLGSEEYIQRHISVLSGSIVWTPSTSSIPPGTMVGTTVTVNGSQVGDTIAVAVTDALPVGAILSGSVTASDTIGITLLNASTSPIQVPTGKLRIDVWKH